MNTGISAVVQVDRRAVIFDLDGTLTVPFLDFDAIRAEIGITRGPILESVSAMTGAERVRAETIMARHEAQAAAASELQPGAAEVVATLRRSGIPVALMTRNSRSSVVAFQARHGIRFDRIRTREDGAIKPSPEPVYDLCQSLGADPRSAWVVGDFEYDLRCGRGAGATTVLLWNEGRPLPVWGDQADHVIDHLSVLPGLLGLGEPTSQAQMASLSQCGQTAPSMGPVTGCIEPLAEREPERSPNASLRTFPATSVDLTDPSRRTASGTTE